MAVLMLPQLRAVLVSRLRFCQRLFGWGEGDGEVLVWVWGLVGWLGGGKLGFGGLGVRVTQN